MDVGVSSWFVFMAIVMGVLVLVTFWHGTAVAPAIERVEPSK